MKEYDYLKSSLYLTSAKKYPFLKITTEEFSAETISKITENARKVDDEGFDNLVHKLRLFIGFKIILRNEV